VALLIVITTALTTLPLRYVSGYIFFDQLFVNSTTRLLFIVTLFIYLLPSLFMVFIALTKVSVPTDYTSVNLMFFVIAPFILLSPNFYSFFFLIELLGVLILVKFIFLPLTYSGKGQNKGHIASSSKPLTLSIFTYY
jgi:hypothetical protein